MEENKQEFKDKKVKKYIGIIALVVVLMGITIGFALLSTTLSINGVSRVEASEWNVHFDNLVPNNNSVTPDVAAYITDDDLNINYTVTLDKPGDFYEFTVDVVNEGTIDAKLNALPSISGISAEQEEYVNCTITHTDGSEILVGESINVGGSENFTVRLEFDDSITDDSQLPKTDQTLQIDIEMIYGQK